MGIEEIQKKIHQLRVTLFNLLLFTRALKFLILYFATKLIFYGIILM